ncbi:hypothetical protein FRC11_012862 [Ceratobasidium sp. 423]|nr:hypothetical protein FRC11_012862 [Ceratobasidium sp. 423]
MAAQAKAPVSRKRALSTAPPPSFEACVVTYISQDRAFQRVFVETDIEGMRNVVREKLNLAPNTGVRLAQVAEGRRIDLEDDADFKAFQLGARLKPELQVEVSIVATPAAQLASPSVTATSVNLEQAPPPLTQTRKDETPQTADGSTSAPPPAKRKKSRKSNLIIVDDAEQGSSKLVEPDQPIKIEQAPKVPKSKAQAADPAPTTTTTEPAKKPKSKPKSVPPVDQEPSSTLEVPKQPDDPAAEAPSAQPKPKKGKKAAATTPAPETSLAATTEPIPETSPADTEFPQPRPKKRGHKAAQDVEQQEPTAPETTGTAEPPTKKQRKSKADVVVDTTSGSQSPVATTLPPPVRSERRSSTVLSLPDPDKPVSSIGSAADILRRWGDRSVATETASSSGAGPPTTIDVVDRSTETKTKPKRKRKKKDQTADDTSTATSAPAPSPAETAQCLVCSSGPHESLECPILSKRDSESAKIVEERIQNLQDTQGFARIHQMLIGSLRRWMKDFKKQVEAQNIFVTSSPAPPVQKSSSPTHSTPVPTRPKKSKLSSVAVSHQSEGSSTEDEDILKSVMESRVESTEDDDGGDEEMDDASEPEPAPAPELHKDTTPPSTPTPTPSPKAASVPLPLSSSPTTKALLQSQRMSQSSLRALLDGLESEEAGDGDGDSSGEEGSDLAQSTPSEVARRRHRKSVRLDVEDSDEEAAARAQTQVQAQKEYEDGDDGDVEMRDAGDERELTTLSQLLDSSQNIPEEIVGVVDEEQDEDDIEEYEDEEQENKQAPGGDAGSPIETPDQEPVVVEEEVVETGQEEGPEPAQDEPEPAQELEPVSPAPKKRGRPPLPQSVKDERAAEKARIQAEKAASQGLDPSAPRKRGRPPKQKPVEGGADTSTASVGSQGPRPRGRPRLSDTTKAERQQEKERIRAEKAIKRLEKKTAKAAAKAAKGKGANTSTPVDDGDNDEGEDEDEDTTVHQSFHAPEETTELLVPPIWSTLKNPSSSRPGSSQADEIEWSATEAGEDGNGKQPSGSRSAVKPTPGRHTRNGSASAKPLFMPSSGLGPRFLPPSSPLASTPAPGKLLSLSQQTPSNVLQRRKSIGSESVPRFSNFKKKHDDQQRSRKEQKKRLSSQPITLDLSQGPKPKANGASEVVTIVSSDEEADSSADETNKPKPQSQRKRPSAFAYFEQS